MHLAFYLPLSSSMRRNTNYWLAFWGKWSLADALVMCCLIGLFNLSIDMDVVQAWNSLHTDVDSLCQSQCLRLANSTSARTIADCDIACSTIENLLSTTAFNYDALHSSRVFLNVRISGLISMYAFCLAVIVSLTTGVFIETLDEEARERRSLDPSARLDLSLQPLHSTDIHSQTDQIHPVDQTAGTSAEPLPLDPESATTSRLSPRSRPNLRRHDSTVRALSECGSASQCIVHSVLVRLPLLAGRSVPRAFSPRAQRSSC